MNINECGCRPYGWLGLDGDRCIRVIPRQSPMRLFPKIVEVIFGKDIKSPVFQNVVHELAGWVMP